MKRLSTIVAIFSLILLGFGAVAMADTIMFPYINSNPGNVSTLISVVNGNINAGALHYRYITKAHTAGLLDACLDQDFCRATSLTDLVTFDASGNINGGLAMFNDPGAGTFLGLQIPYGGPFNNTQQPQPRIGYLLVTHHGGGNCVAGNDITGDGGVNTYLDGEAMLIDIVNGEAWGYKAALNNTTGVINNFAFQSSDETLIEDNHSFFENTVIFPPQAWLSKYFVTPLFIQVNNTPPTPNIAANSDMHDVVASHQKRTRMSLNCWSNNGAGSEPLGVMDRNENCLSGGVPVHVRCVAALSLRQLLGDNLVDDIIPLGINDTGGWATVDLINPSRIVAEGEAAIPVASYDAFVYDLKYTENFEGAASFTNDGKVIRSKANALRIGAGAD